MSQILIDLPVIDKDDFKEWKKIIGRKLKKVSIDCDDLVLEFDGWTVTISRQYSDAYGDNVFWNFQKEE